MCCKCNYSTENKFLHLLKTDITANLVFSNQFASCIFTVFQPANFTLIFNIFCWFRTFPISPPPLIVVLYPSAFELNYM